MAEDNRPHSTGTNPTSSSRPASARPVGGAHAGKHMEPAKRISGSVQRQRIGVSIDRGVFSQLLTAAQQSGLNVNADAIIGVRDRELRAGRYQKAFDVIEAMYIHFGAEAARRQADLRREEMQVRSGALKISPKEWLLRQQRYRDQTLKIERARRQFARVLDGLTAMRAMESR